jgi:hypothetical protein
VVLKDKNLRRVGLPKPRRAPLRGRASAVVAASLWFATTLVTPSVAAPIFGDGFETGNLSAWSGSASFSVQQATVHAGSWAGRASSTGGPSHAWRSFAAETELTATVWLNVTSRSTAVWLTSFRPAGGGATLLVGLNGKGKLIARNNVTKVTYVSTIVVGNGGWHELEVHAKTGTAGRFDVTFDDAPVAALSRANNLGAGTFSRLTIGDSVQGRSFNVAFDDVSLATDATPGDTIDPSQPMGLVATTLDTSSVDLDWQASSDDTAVTGYGVYRSLDGSTFSLVASTGSTAFLDDGLDPGTTYWWKVDAVDAAGNRSLLSDAATATTSSDGTPATIGRWSAPFEIGTIGVHASVLFTGKVLLFYKTTDPADSSKLWDPATGTITDVPVPIAFQHNLFCSAHSLRPNGDVFVTGGTLWGAGNPNGTTQTALFDPVTERWRQGPAMSSARWYPTDVSLADGDTLVFAGRVSGAETATEVERYDAGTSSFSTLPAAATLSMGTYPRMFALPDGRVVRVGTERRTMFFDPDAPSWTSGPDMRFGARPRGSVVLLPGLDQVLAIGGLTGTGATATTEILDLGPGEPAWRLSDSMHEPRKNLNVVLLPDGSVLAVGGNRGSGLYDQPVLGAEMFDPTTETWIEMAPQVAPRAYHSTALLLPDGRILSAGHDDGPMQATAEIYSPPYLFRGPRPVIDTAPTAVGYGSSFTVGTSQAATIADVALVRANSSTHGVNFDQRHVPLTFSAETGGLTVSAPASGAVAPPGWYMLFLIDDAGVPSVAKWVRIS